MKSIFFVGLALVVLFLGPQVLAQDVIEGEQPVSGGELINVDSVDGESKDDVWDDTDVVVIDTGGETNGIIIGGWDSVAEGAGAIIGDSGLEDDLALETLEGIEVEEPTKMPSGWGLFWRGVKERVAIVATFDPVKKAEKRLKYAVERTKLAEFIAEKAENPKAQAKAEQMARRAGKLMDKVEKNKDKWIENQDERARRLLKNAATYQIKRDRVLDVLEEKLPEEKMEKLKELRDQGLERSRRLMNAVNNENVPEQVREHLQNVKDRVEQHAQEVQAHQEKKKILLQAVKNGDEEAKDKLKDLQQERKEKLKTNREIYKEKKQNLIEAVQNGSIQAKKKLKAMDMVEETRQKAIQERENLQQFQGHAQTGAVEGNAIPAKKLEMLNTVKNRVIQNEMDSENKSKGKVEFVPSEGIAPQAAKPKVDVQTNDAWKVEEAEAVTNVQ